MASTSTPSVFHTCQAGLPGQSSWQESTCATFGHKLLDILVGASQQFPDRQHITCSSSVSNGWLENFQLRSNWTEPFSKCSASLPRTMALSRHKQRLATSRSEIVGSFYPPSEAQVPHVEHGSLFRVLRDWRRCQEQITWTDLCM